MGSSGGVNTPTPPRSPPSSSAAIARNCAPASSADSACNPGKGDASPHPTRPSSSSTRSKCPRRTPAVSLASPSFVVGFFSIGSSNPRTDADTTRGVPLDWASRRRSAHAAAAPTRACNARCCSKFRARDVVTSTTLCRPSDHAASSARLSAAGVLGCECATLCASHNPRLETSGGVAKSFVNAPESIRSATGKKEKMPPPPLLTTTTVTGG